MSKKSCERDLSFLGETDETATMVTGVRASLYERVLLQQIQVS